MKPNEDQAKPDMTSEFINPVDHIDKGNYPIKEENGEFYMPFFIFKFAYPLGPVLFRMGMCRKRLSKQKTFFNNSTDTTSSTNCSKNQYSY